MMPKNVKYIVGSCPNVLGHFLAVLPLISGKIVANLSRNLHRYFHGSLCSLSHGVNHVLALGSKFEMVWTATGSVVPTWAVVKNPFPFWNRPTEQNPRCSMSVNLPVESFRNVAIANATFSFVAKQPASVLIKKSYLGEESFREILTQSLRKKIPGISIDVHNQLRWLCRALGCSFTARAFSF